MNGYFQSPKYHEVDAFGFFTEPNDVISEALGFRVDIFSEGDVLCTHSHGSNETHEEKVKNILEHGTARYYCEMYPEGHPTYTEDYPVGAFHAHSKFPDKEFFLHQNNRHGPLLLVYERGKLEKTRPSNSIYVVKDGYTFQEALLGLFDPNFGKNMRERLTIQENIMANLRSNK